METKSKSKYQNAILYFAKHLNQYQLGKTKLAKLLYYLDFISYRDRKRSVTNTLYYKQEFGPLAKDLTEMIGDMVSNNSLELTRVIVDDAKQRDEFHAVSNPNEKVFDEYELSLLRKLVNTYGSVSTDVIIAKSHLEAPWVKAKNGGLLDYKDSFDIEDFDPKIELEAKEEDRKFIEAFERELRT